MDVSEASKVYTGDGGDYMGFASKKIFRSIVDSSGSLWQTEELGKK